MAIIKILGYKCERCNHTWTPRDEEEPVVCPKCKSPYWNKPRIIKLTKGGVLKNAKT